MILNPPYRQKGKGGEIMKKHYNLYYIFLEDKLRNAMPAFRAEEIRRAVVRAYEALKGLGRQPPLLTGK